MDEITRAVHDDGRPHGLGPRPQCRCGTASTLDDCDVDFAVGSTYKYLNGGPGSPAFVFAASRLHEAIRANRSPAGMATCGPSPSNPTTCRPPGSASSPAARPRSSRSPSLEGSLEVWQHVELPALFAKGQALCDLLIELIEPCLATGGLELVSPRDRRCPRQPRRAAPPRGARHPRRALARRGVVGDFRAPDLIRLGIAPLYLRYVDIWDAAARSARSVLGPAYPCGELTAGDPDGRPRADLPDAGSGERLEPRREVAKLPGFGHDPEPGKLGRARLAPTRRPRSRSRCGSGCRSAGGWRAARGPSAPASPVPSGCRPNMTVPISQAADAARLVEGDGQRLRPGTRSGGMWGSSAPGVDVDGVAADRQDDGHARPVERLAEVGRRADAVPQVARARPPPSALGDGLEVAARPGRRRSGIPRSG